MPKSSNDVGSNPVKGRTKLQQLKGQRLFRKRLLRTNLEIYGFFFNFITVVIHYINCAFGQEINVLLKPRKPKEQSRISNLETWATLDTRHNENRQNRNHNTENLQDEQHGLHTTKTLGMNAAALES